MLQQVPALLNPYIRNTHLCTPTASPRAPATPCLRAFAYGSPVGQTAGQAVRSEMLMLLKAATALNKWQKENDWCINIPALSMPT